MFDFLPVAASHFIVRNYRYSVRTVDFMFLKDDGTLHLAEAFHLPIITVAINQVGP
jgi:hypothetical protein